MYRYCEHIHIYTHGIRGPIRGTSTTPGTFPTVCGRAGAEGSPQRNIAAAWMGHVFLNPTVEAPIVMGKDYGSPVFPQKPQIIIT